MIPSSKKSNISTGRTVPKEPTFNILQWYKLDKATSQDKTKGKNK